MGKDQEFRTNDGEAGLKRAIRKGFQIGSWVAKTTIYWGWTALVGFTIVAGWITLYDVIRGDGEIPEPQIAPIWVAQKGVFNTTPRWSSDPEENWQALQPTIAICDEVVPHVGEWVRERYAAGKIQWRDDPNSPTLARWHSVSKTLSIDRAFFDGDDGRKASWLSHEWRHSRQNKGKVSRCALSLILLFRQQTDIVENDAWLYERQVYLAIFETIFSHSKDKAKHGNAL